MKRIYLKTKNWKDSVCYIHTKDGKTIKKGAILDNNHSFYIDTDINKDDYVVFSNGKKAKSRKIYVDDIISNYEYKKNRVLNRELTYIDNIYEDGKIEEVRFVDKKNLSNWTGKKKVWFYTPSDYNPNKKYGLLIAFDGQASFYKNKFYKKNWYEGVQLDLFAEEFKDFIVIGIDNGSIYRDQELTMNHEFGELIDKLKGTDFSHGNLDLILDFINENVLPFALGNYNIDKNRIGVIGSSSGGLASYYAALRNPEIYSYGICLSPAFCLFERESFSDFLTRRMKEDINLPKFYFYTGNISLLEKDIEVSTMEVYEDMIKFNYPNDRLTLRVDKNGSHNEECWRLVIGEALKFTRK